LTIVIPTHNRYAMLLRVLRYIDEVKSDIPVIILDSSSDKPGIFQNTLEALIQKYGIVWLRYESTISPIQKIKEGLEGVTTPYAVLWADDDFLIPASLIHEVEFLEEHPEFNVVHGEAGIFNVIVRNERNEIRGVSLYPQHSITNETAVQRLINHMQHYTTTFYSIHRTEHLRRHFVLCVEHKFGWQWAEIFLSCLAVIDGKTQKISYLHMFREVHAGSDSWNANDGKRDFFDWIVGPDLNAQYREFREVLAAAIVRLDKISIEEARSIVKWAFWGYLSKGLYKKYRQHYTEESTTTPIRIKKIIKNIPGIVRIWHGIQFLLFPVHTIALPVLLNPRSPYYKDFMPIYHLITTSK